jgi:hypothetical protein
MPDDIAECLMSIASRVAKKINFCYYSFLDDMIADAIFDGCRYLHNFNPEKSSNGFAYITTLVHHAFIRRIKEENEHTHVKMLVSESQCETDQLNKYFERENRNNTSFTTWKVQVLAKETNMAVRSRNGVRSRAKLVRQETERASRECGERARKAIREALAKERAERKAVRLAAKAERDAVKAKARAERRAVKSTGYSNLITPSGILPSSS